MRGDVNGDGVITKDDADVILQSVGGIVTLSDIQQWCADVNNDGTVDGMDSVAIQRYVSGVGDITKEDYYNNWTWNGNYWTTDIVIPDIDATYDVVFTIGNKENKESFVRAERSKTINLIRVYVKTPPVEDIDATIICKKGTGKFITTFESPKPHASTHASDGDDPITPKSIGAAPDGYGLGGVGKLLTSADNIDTLKTNGWYYWRTSSLPQGTLPTSVMQYCTQIRVTNDGATTCVQEAFGITDGNTTRNCLVRRILYGSSRIYNWQWVNPPFVQGTVYETVEKYDGKVVYKKKLADGIYWSIDDGATWKPEAIYVGALPISGGTMTGSLVLKGDPAEDLEAATKQYVDNHTVSAMVYEELPAKPSAPIADGEEIPYTWKEINAITLSGKAQEYFSLGATKLVNLSTAVLGANAATMMVIGFDQDGENTVTFQTKGVLPTNTVFGSNADWIRSTARTHCLNFYNYCEAKDFIKIVSKGTCSSTHNYRSCPATYNDEMVWLPSEREMGLDTFAPLSTANSTTSNAECTKGYNAAYSYYTSNTTRVKYRMNADGTLTTTAFHYWERSLYYNNATSACIVNSDGSAIYDAYDNNYYLAPAFVIGNGTSFGKIIQDGEDITDKVKELITSDPQNPVFLKRVTTSTSAASISIDVSDINFDDYYEVVMYTDLIGEVASLAGTPEPICRMTINNESGKKYGFSNGTNASGSLTNFNYIYQGALLNSNGYVCSPCKVYIRKKKSIIFVYGSYTYASSTTYNHAVDLFGEHALATSDTFSSLQIKTENARNAIIMAGSTIEFWGYKK